MTTDLQALIQHLRGGDWNLRAPQEMADMIADKLEAALAAAPSTSPAAAPTCAKCGRPTNGCYSEGCFTEGCPVAKPTFSAPVMVNGLTEAETAATASVAGLYPVADLCDCGCNEPCFTDPIEALRFLSQRLKLSGVSDAVARDYARDLDRILARIDSAAPSPSAAERWIPVSERLPEPDVQCLVLWRAGDEYLPAIASRCVRWKRMLLWHGHAGSHNDVTHWMPLLAAPAAPSASPAEAPAADFLFTPGEKTAFRADLVARWPEPARAEMTGKLYAHPQPVAPAGQAAAGVQGEAVAWRVRYSPNGLWHLSHSRCADDVYERQPLGVIAPAPAVERGAAAGVQGEKPNRNDPVSALAIRAIVAKGYCTQEQADECFSWACDALEAEAARMNEELPWVTRVPAQAVVRGVAEERAAFEAWVGAQTTGRLRNTMWHAWQARAALSTSTAPSGSSAPPPNSGEGGE